jgi:histone H3/H4
VQGTKRERKGATDWYRAIEQANIERILKEWTAKQQQAGK